MQESMQNNNSRLNERERGFTLIEMIGVLAVIAVLASMVAPKIFDAIRDSKVDTLLSDVSNVRTEVVSFYKDTSRFPEHQAGPAAAAGFNEMITNSVASATAGVVGAAIRGWRGPYLDKQLANPLNPNSNISVESTRLFPGTIVSFDINGDGVVDYTNGAAPAGNPNALKNDISYMVIDGLSFEEAQRISQALDSDVDAGAAGVAGGAVNWWQTGRVVAFNAATFAAAQAGPAALPVRNADVAVWIFLGAR